MVPGGERTSRARSVSDFVSVFNGFKRFSQVCFEVTSQGLE